jgi:hypothetical protein
MRVILRQAKGLKKFTLDEFLCHTEFSGVKEFQILIPAFNYHCHEFRHRLMGAIEQDALSVGRTWLCIEWRRVNRMNQKKLQKRESLFSKDEFHLHSVVSQRVETMKRKWKRSQREKPVKSDCISFDDIKMKDDPNDMFNVSFINRFPHIDFSPYFWERVKMTLYMFSLFEPHQ